MPAQNLGQRSVPPQHKSPAAAALEEAAAGVPGNKGRSGKA